MPLDAPEKKSGCSTKAIILVLIVFALLAFFLLYPIYIHFEINS
jgi:flagellar basal body-associated protein FliL